MAHLTKQERCKTENFLIAGVPLHKKARILGRTHTTINRELKRHQHEEYPKKLVVEVASETNYRRAVSELARNGKISLPHQTAHGWMIKTDCDEIQLSKKVVGSAPIQIMPGGTGFKGEGKSGEARKGDLKVVIGVTARGEIFPLGAKAGVSWQEINDDFKKIAYGWSDKGVTKVARIILKRFANAGEWEEYWQERMRGVGNVVVNIGNYRCFSQDLGQ